MVATGHPSLRGFGRRPGRFLGSLGGGLRFELLAALHVLLEDRLAMFGGPGADALPVLDARGDQRNSLGRIGHVGIVSAEFLDGPAVARLAVIDRHDAVIVAMGPAHLLHSNSHGHGERPQNAAIRGETSLY